MVDPKLQMYFLRHYGARATDLSLSICSQITVRRMNLIQILPRKKKKKKKVCEEMG